MRILPKIYQRDFPIFVCQLRGRRYSHIFGKDVPFVPRNVVVAKDGLTDFYRDDVVERAMNDILLSHVASDERYIENLFAHNGEDVTAIERYIGAKTLSRKELIDFIHTFYSLWESLYAGLHVPLDSRFLKSAQSAAYNFRKSIDKVEYASVIRMQDAAVSLYGTPLARYVYLKEIETDSIPPESELARRANTTLYIADEEVLKREEYEAFSREHEFILEAEKDAPTVREFTGQIACEGRARGPVRVIIRTEDVALFEEGGVLVSPMTVPTFMPAMKKAVAFVTDEGGITCHAAIVAREMGKPCIIGTKIATKTLKNGDMVEVDANQGIVRILNS